MAAARFPVPSLCLVVPSRVFHGGMPAKKALSFARASAKVIFRSSSSVSGWRVTCSCQPPDNK